MQQVATMKEMRNGQNSGCIEYGIRRKGLAHPIPMLQQWLLCVTWVACGSFLSVKMSSAGCASGDEAFMNLGMLSLGWDHTGWSMDG